MNQKLMVRKAMLEKENIESGVKKSSSAKEKELESQIKTAQKDLDSINTDIERLNSYQAPFEGEPIKDALHADLRTVKEFIREAIEGGVGSKVVSENEELNELAAIVPKELERVLSRKAKLESELRSMQSLLKIVGTDMIAGI